MVAVVDMFGHTDPLAIVVFPGDPVPMQAMPDTGSILAVLVVCTQGCVSNRVEIATDAVARHRSQWVQMKPQTLVEGGEDSAHPGVQVCMPAEVGANCNIGLMRAAVTLKVLSWA